MCLSRRPKMAMFSGAVTNQERKSFVEEIIKRNEELHNRRSDGEIHHSIMQYWDVKDGYTRDISNAMGEHNGNGSSDNIYRKESESNGISKNQSSESSGWDKIRKGR